jgi:hypothetical protein
MTKAGRTAGDDVGWLGRNLFFYLEVGHLQFWQMDPNILIDAFEIEKVWLWCFCICTS